jgi:2-phospho-L-lactate guanylyltransferase
MSRPLTCLVPLRSPGEGKSRLAPGLDTGARAALAGAMLADVVSVLREAGIDRLVVAANGAPAAAAAAALGADVVLDDPGTFGLDAAVEHARRRVALQGDLLVVQADLPVLSANDVDAVLSADASVVVAPTRDGGTGALLRRPSGVMPTAFGRDSARAHRRLARRHGLRALLVDLPGFASDVDTWQDLIALRTADVGPATAAFLRRLRDESSA